MLNSNCGQSTIFAGKHYLCKMTNPFCMGNKDLNRLKLVLAEKKHTNKWFAEQMEKDPATVSKWCTNSAQPSLENLIQMAKCLGVEIQELIRQ